MVTGLVMTVVGFWIFWMSGRRARRYRTDVEKVILALQRAVGASEREKAVLAAKLAIAEAGRAMDTQVAMDSIQREERAKASLRSALIDCGCSDAQIASVLESVDNVQPGDLR